MGKAGHGELNLVRNRRQSASPVLCPLGNTASLPTVTSAVLFFPGESRPRVTVGKDRHWEPAEILVWMLAGQPAKPGKYGPH